MIFKAETHHIASNCSSNCKIQNLMNLDVILKKNRFGFDACLMMSYAAAYEFHDIADYYIASEATEPGTFIFLFKKLYLIEKFIF